MRYHCWAKLIVATVLLTVISGVARTQTGLSTPLDRDTSVTVGQLPNGLTYYIKSNPKPAHKVELRLVIKAGSIQEGDDQQGLAHFMEHMEFNGLRHYPKNDLVNYLQDIGVRFGADLNANTSWDRTYFLLPIPTDDPDHLRQGFRILSDWAAGALIGDSEVNAERGVILEELRMRNKNAQARMMRRFLPVMLNHSRYARRQPGGKDTIVRFAPAQRIRDFYQDWYRPDLMAVIVVGDMPSAQARAMIEKYFAHLENPSPERRRSFYTVSPYLSKKGMVVTDPEASDYGFTLIYPSHPADRDTTIGGFRKSLVKSIFIQSVNRKLRDMTQLATPPFAKAGLSLSGSIGSLTLNDQAMELDVTPLDDLRTSVKAAIRALLNVAAFGFSEKDITTSRNVYLPFYENAYKERNDRMSASFTDGYADAFMKDLPIIGIENEYAYVKALLPTISAAEVNVYAKKVLRDPENYYAMLTGPSNGKLKLPVDSGLVRLVDSAFAQTPERGKDAKLAEGLLKHPPKAGKIIQEEKDSILGTTTYTLSNGVLVTVKSTDFQKDQVLFSGIKYGGTNIYGPGDKPNVTFLGSVIGSMGFGQFSPAALSDFLSGKRVHVNVGMSGITDEINGASSVKDMGTMLQLAYLQLTSARKDTTLWKSWNNKVRARIPLLKTNPQNLFSDSLTKLLYGHHPLTPIVIPTKADLDRVQLDRILQIYREQFGKADGFHFFFVGNVEQDSLKPLIETYLASLPVSGKQPGYKDSGLRKVKGSHLFKYYKGKDQKSSLIDMYYGDIPYSSDLAMKAHLLAEAMTIKVLDTIREKMQLIYSGNVSASVSERPYGQYSITAQMPCGPENVEKIFKELDREVAACKISGVTEGDLRKVKKAVIEQFKEGLKQNSTWLAEIKQVGFWKHDSGDFLNYEKRVNAITSDQLKTTANLLLTGNHFKAATFPEKN